MRRVAIIGMAGGNKAVAGEHEGSLRTSAPWADPEWEKWVLGHDVGVGVADLVFEIHCPRKVPEVARRQWARQGLEGYEDHLRFLGCPVVQTFEWGDFPRRVIFPMEEIKALVGCSTGSREAYLESSIGFMLAYALLVLEPGDTIGLWGCDMREGREYAYQRPNIEFLLGLARGRGILEYIPAKSGIKASAYEGGRYGLD